MSTTTDDHYVLEGMKLVELWIKGREVWNAWIRANPKARLDFRTAVFLQNFDKPLEGFCLPRRREIKGLLDCWGINAVGALFAQTINAEDALDLWKKGKKVWNQHIQQPKYQDYDVNFEGVVFPDGDIDFIGFIFPKKSDVNFSGAKFGDGIVSFIKIKFGEGDVNFSGAKFGDRIVNFIDIKFGEGDVNFSGAKFGDGIVNFINIKFGEGDVNFSGAKFGDGKVNFTKIEFGEGDVNFSGAEFGDGIVKFTEIEFGEGDVNFFGAKFGDVSVNFMNVKFGKGAVNFTNAEFGKRVGNFSNAEFFKGIANFTKAKFVKLKMNFSKTEFGKRVENSSNAEFFKGIANFTKAKFFKLKVNFSGAKFGDGLVNFTKAKFFKRVADFTNAEFGKGDVSFSGAMFGEGDVSFTSAMFGKGDVDFSRTEFGKGKFDFSGVRCGDGEINFIDAMFGVYALDFSQVAFGNGHVQFSGAVFNGTFVSFSRSIFGNGSVNFFNAMFSEANVHFDHADFGYGSVDFEGVKFGSLNFYQIKTANCTTLNLKGVSCEGRINFSGMQTSTVLDLNESSIKRPVNFDDTNIGYQAFTWQDVKRTCHIWLPRAKNKTDESAFRRLKKLAKESEDHDRTLEFFAKEKRCSYFNRLSIFSPKLWAYLLYDWLSDYGRSLVRPLIFLVVSWLSFSFVYLDSARLSKAGLLSAADVYTVEQFKHCDDQSALLGCEVLALVNQLSFGVVLTEFYEKHCSKVCPVFDSAQDFSASKTFPFLSSANNAKDSAIRAMFGDEIKSDDPHPQLDEHINIPMEVHDWARFQNLISIMLLSLFVIAIRNRFRT